MENGVNPEGNSLSLDQGADMLASIVSDEPEKKEATPERAAGEPEQANEADVPDQVSEEETEQGETEPSEQEEPEASEESEEPETTDDAPEEPKTIRLSDGTEVTLADVEKGFMRDADYRRKTMELAEHRKAVQTREAEIAQKTQSFDQHLNFALELIGAHLPQKPDPALIHSDPIGYMQQLADFEARSGQLQQLMTARQEADAFQQAETNRAMQEALRSEADALAGAIPELRDPAKQKQVLADIVEGAKQYGFSQEDVNSARDHRLFLMARDAAAYRRLMSNKPKADAKAKAASPVQKPGARTSPQALQGKVAKDKWDTLRRTGSIDAGAAVLLELVKG